MDSIEKKIRSALHRAGFRFRVCDRCWRYCTVWECTIRGKDPKMKIEKVTDQIIEWLEECTGPELEIRG